MALRRPFGRLVEESPQQLASRLARWAIKHNVDSYITSRSFGGAMKAGRCAFGIYWKPVLLALVIAGAGLWIYWSTLQAGWLWDDGLLVRDNSSLRSLRGLGKIWTGIESDYSDYWPLTWTLLWIEWHLWENQPLGYHLCSLVLHISSGLLIWRVFNRLGLRWAWFGGLLFVIHPLAVESVAWASEIKNTLSLPLLLLSINAWLDAEEKQSSGSYWRSVFYYLAAMLAKTSTVMLPLVLLLYCWWKRGHVTRQEFKRMMPYVAIAVTLGLITIFTQNRLPSDDPIVLGGIITRLTGAGTALLFYLYKFILPIRLLPIYPRWTLDPPSVLEVLTLPALAVLFFGLWTQRKGWGRHALLGFGFFVLNLLPVLGLVKMTYFDFSWVADHLTYLPMIGLIGLVAVGLEQLHERVLPFPPRILAAAIVPTATTAIVGLLLWQSHSYARIFANSETLWTYTVQYNPDSWVVHANLGIALTTTGRPLLAIDQFEEALKLRPGIAIVHNDLGVALARTGHLSEAIEHFKQALQIKPDFALARDNLAKAYCSGRC